MKIINHIKLILKYPLVYYEQLMSITEMENVSNDKQTKQNKKKTRFVQNGNYLTP